MIYVRTIPSIDLPVIIYLIVDLYINKFIRTLALRLYVVAKYSHCK